MVETVQVNAFVFAAYLQLNEMLFIARVVVVCLVAW